MANMNITGEISTGGNVPVFNADLPGSIIYGLQGPEGPVGPVGPAGPIGPTGPAGPEGKPSSYGKIIETATGEVISLTDSAEMALEGLKLYGKTTQNGTPTPEAPVALDSAGDDGSITVKVATSETDTNPQTLIVPTPNGLPGIPVPSGGNYTDESGQRWICDEIDFARGKYINRVGRLNMSNYKNLNVGVNSAGLRYMDVRKTNTDGNTSYSILCNCYKSYVPNSNVVTDKMVRQWVDSITVYDSDFTELETAKAKLESLGFECLYPIRREMWVESDLSAEQLAQYATLHTNYPNTTIYTDDGAGMEVTYVADTKMYVNNAASYDGEYELIETIVCDGTFGTIRRDNLSLKRAKIYLNMKAGSTTLSCGVEGNNDAGMFGYAWIGNLINTGERFSTVLLVSDGKNAYTEYTSPAGTAYNSNAVNRTAYYQNADTPIKRINIYASGSGATFPEGSTIEIWGVRA